MKTPFIWLGSGRAEKWAVAAKGRHLDKAAKAGLPVPPGAILLDELFQLLLNEGVVVTDNGRITAPDPDWLHETIYQSVRFPPLDKPVAVRTASATAIAPQLDINFTHPTQLSGSLCKLWSQLTGRRDVLVMEMREMKVMGTAVTTNINEHNTIHIPNKPPLTLPQLTRWQRPAADFPPHLQRLQQLLRGIRRTFGQGEWLIDWLDDGRICWLIQIDQ
jgi:pyruvate,water dikinase